MGAKRKVVVHTAVHSNFLQVQVAAYIKHFLQCVILQQLSIRGKRYKWLRQAIYCVLQCNNYPCFATHKTGFFGRQMISFGRY
jgi:hypothetical protein